MELENCPFNIIPKDERLNILHNKYFFSVSQSIFTMKESLMTTQPLILEWLFGCILVVCVKVYHVT